MEYIYLIGAVCFSAMLSIMGALFNKVNENGENFSAFYNFIVTTSAFIVWGIIYIMESGFEWGVLLYSTLYGICYTCALMGLICALKCGKVSLTSFIKQLSLVGVAVWGALFWNATLDVNVVIGIILIIPSMYLCFKSTGNDEKSISLRWLICILMLFVGNAGCSIVQKYQQMTFDGNYGSMLMFFGCGFSAVVCFILYKRRDVTSHSKMNIRRIGYPVMAGISSALLNLFIIRLALSSLSPAVIYPVIAVGGMLVTILFSVTVCKEKLNLYQWFGLMIGVIAVVFLNLK